MAHVTVAGAGAIGSHLLSHLARSPRVSRITIVDFDRYEAPNVRSQEIDARHVGQPKATVQARRLRRISPHLEVDAVCGRVEDIPLGALRSSLLAACLDSRAARMAVNQAAWRLGVPWIDAGVDADGLLARVRGFVPGACNPCLECAWDEADYRALEQRYPCADAGEPAATGAPSMLGGLAAALQAIECDKLLAGETGSALVGQGTLLDARHHKHYVTEYRRNPSCRMPDHDGWHISPLSGSCAQTTLSDVLTLGSTLRGAATHLSFGVAGQRIATALRCALCAAPRATFQLESRLRARRAHCPQCGSTLSATGFDLHELAPGALVPEAAHELTLAELGIRPHDVLTLRTPEIAAHFEVG